jgi:hypothetical protein
MPPVNNHRQRLGTVEMDLVAARWGAIDSVGTPVSEPAPRLASPEDRRHQVLGIFRVARGGRTPRNAVRRTHDVYDNGVVHLCYGPAEV